MRRHPMESDDTHCSERRPTDRYEAARSVVLSGDPAREQERHGRIPCPVCGFLIGAVRGSKAAVCSNCGFKDGCC